MATVDETDLEQRTIDVDVQDIDTRGRTLHGYAAVYNATSEDLGGFRERIAAGAFTDVLDGDVRALLNHDPSQVLGRTRSGTLRLFDEARGLRFEIDLPDSPLGQNVREAVRRGDIDGASFRFKVARDSWQDDLRKVERVAELKDITVATFGAYPAASVELRTKPNPAVGQEVTQMAEATQHTEQHVDEARVDERIPAGSLRVEERAEPPAFLTLADLYKDRGFFENRYASVTWDEYRAVTYTPGTALIDLAPSRQTSAPYGYDRRWVYTVFPSTAVDHATTSVQYIKQTARSLAGTAVVRDLDAVTTKPETSSTVDYATLQLSQVATVCSNVPRILTNQPLFQSIVQSDLQLSINDGLDTIAIRGVNTAGTLATTSGTALIDIRRCITGLQSAGYAPDTLLIDPAGAEALDLLQSYGTERLWTFGAGRFAPGDIFGLTVRVGKNAGTAVLDSTAFGRMYMSPVEVRAFEQDAGATNRQTLRMELSAGFAVERLTAAVRIT